MRIFDTPSITPSLANKLLIVCLALFLLVALAACGPTATPTTPEPTAIPTVTPTEEPTVEAEDTPDPTESDPGIPEDFSTFDYHNLSVLESFASLTPHGTFELYLRDAISQQISLQRQKIDMRARYQQPEVMLQDLGGLIINIELVEDRSELVALRPTVDNPTSAEYNAEIDIRITYADLDTSSQTCAWVVNLQRGINGKWYIVNPRELLIFVDCVPR